MAHYRQSAAEYDRISNALGCAKFSTHCLDDLTSLLGCGKAAQLISSVTRFENYRDSASWSDERKAVSLILSTKGVRLKRGKRTKAGMQEMVRTVAPLLLYFRLPKASSERSRLVTGLRLIAEEIGLDGDPRDELRRWVRVERKIKHSVRSHLYGVLARSLQGLPIDNKSRNTF